MDRAAARRHGDCPPACLCLQATANLATTIIGAGIMALPRAFATLGLLLGAAMLAIIFVLSLFTLSALVRCAAARQPGPHAVSPSLHAPLPPLTPTLSESPS